jgi:amino acid transporter
MSHPTNPVSLRRTLNLPLLVLYGVGVTIGAGIFALMGEIVRIAGDHAPWAFALAGLIAGITGLSYAQLSSVYPRAGGEAVYVNNALGKRFAQLVGYGVTTTAIISSAVIASAFGGYLGTLVPVPQAVLVVGVLLLLGSVAWMGVRESVYFAAIITLLEVGTLLVIIAFGAPALSDSQVFAKVIHPPADLLGVWIVLSAAISAFFAFIGFEDIVNMAEETVDATKTVPRAIVATLAITILVYVVIALIAVAVKDRDALVQSAAPLATLFESVTGMSGKPVSAMASIAMVNGILVQIVMASRVIYGMTKERLAPAALGVLNEKTRTPGRAIVLVTLLIAGLALWLPLIQLAKATSLVTLSVFTLVNLALWRLGSDNTHKVLHRWRYWGLFGAIVCASLVMAEGYWLLLG